MLEKHLGNYRLHYFVQEIKFIIVYFLVFSPFWGNAILETSFHKDGKKPSKNNEYIQFPIIPNQCVAILYYWLHMYFRNYRKLKEICMVGTTLV